MPNPSDTSFVMNLLTRTVCVAVLAPGLLTAGAWGSTSRPVITIDPPAPVVKVHRDGKFVVISYRFSTMPRSVMRRPALLLTSINSAGTRYPPLAFQTTIRSRTGRVRQPLGLGRAPYVISIAAESKTGARSKTTKIVVR